MYSNPGRTTCFVAMSLLVVSASAARADQAKINALKAEIRELERQERERLHDIDAHYHRILSKMDRPEDWLERELARLTREERAALKRVPDKASRDRIRADFNGLRADLRKKIKTMEAEMGKVSHKRDAEKAAVKREYGAKIRTLRARLHELEHGRGKAPTKTTKKHKK